MQLSIQYRVIGESSNKAINFFSCQILSRAGNFVELCVPKMLKGQELLETTPQTHCLESSLLKLESCQSRTALALSISQPHNSGCCTAVGTKDSRLLLYSSHHTQRKSTIHVASPPLNHTEMQIHLVGRQQGTPENLVAKRRFSQ